MRFPSGNEKFVQENIFIDNICFQYDIWSLNSNSNKPIIISYEMFYTHTHTLIQ